MMPRTKTHFWCNDDFVRIVFVYFMKGCTYQAFIIYNNGLYIFLPLFVPVLFFNFIKLKYKRAYIRIFLFDLLQQLFIKRIAFCVRFKTRFGFHKRIEAGFANFGHQDFGKIRITGYC